MEKKKLGEGNSTGSVQVPFEICDLEGGTE